MITDEHLDDALASADPVAGGRLPRPPATFLLALQEHDADPVPGPAPRRTHRRILVGAVAGLAAAGVAVGLAILPGGTPSAFADYDATPTALTTAQATGLVQHCREQRDGAGGPRSDVPTSAPVLAERRGSWEYAVLVSDTEVTTCLARPDDPGHLIIAGGGLTPGESGRPGEGVDLDTSIGTQALPGEEPAPDAFGTAVGRAAADVVAVDVVFADGRVVRTTLTADGWWGAWWPGGLDAAGGGGPTTLRWTTDDGAVREGPFGDG